MDIHWKFMKEYLKRGDLLIILTVLVLAGLLYLPLFFQKEDRKAEIYVNGESVYSIDLQKVAEAYTISVPGSEILVEPGKIGYLNSDCPNGDCVRFGMLERPGSTAACIPNHTMIRIVPGSGKQDTPDAVTY